MKDVNAVKDVSFYLPGPRALFLHIPRTGGTWFKRALIECEIPYELWGKVCYARRFDKKHVPMACHKSSLLERVSRVFTIVRHPVSWYESCWRFRGARHSKNSNRTINWKPQSFMRFHPSFETWLNTLLLEEPCFYTRMVEGYVGPEGREWVDWIGRTETLTDDFRNLMKLFGYRRKLRGHDLDKLYHNSTTDEVRPEWTDEMRELVKEEDRVMIRRFYGEDVDKREYHNPKQR